MTAEEWAVVVAVIAIVVSAGSALYTFRQSRELASSGFKTAEDLKADLVALIAALRSSIYKGIAAGGDNRPRDISIELERIRAFQTSPSGYALAAFAAERGSGSAHDAGRWRILGLQFAELGGIGDSSIQSDGSVAVQARHWATEIETTLGALTARDVDRMALKVSNLPSTIAALAETRNTDLVAGFWFEVAEKRSGESNPQLSLERFRALRSAGVDDPDLDLWIAVLTDDADLLQKALAAGADQSVTAEQVVERYSTEKLDPSATS